MSFQPAVGDQLTIEGITYHIAEHPAAPGMPYGQEGRAAVVYQIISTAGEPRALKLFKPRFRLPAMVSLADKLLVFSDLPGLAVCRRAVLTPQRHVRLLRQFPDLTYAVLMPWIVGPTWMEVVATTRPLSTDESLCLAHGLVNTLNKLEEHGAAHCDLSGPNILLPGLEPSAVQPSDPVALVDVEQMYGPGLVRPDALPAGSSGYAHMSAHADMWTAAADRFAGAVIIAEMLGWCEERVRDAAWGESYFEPTELQQDSARYQTLSASVCSHWGQDVANLLDRAWRSTTLSDCPTFGEWVVALPASAGAESSGRQPDPRPNDNVSQLLVTARRFEEQGDLEAALAAYRRARQATPPTSSLYKELEVIEHDLQVATEQYGHLKTRLAEAEQHKAEGRWHVAAAIYEDALTRPGMGQPQIRAWQHELGHCREEANLAGLFDTAQQMIAQSRWDAAQELLADIVRQRPVYERNGVKAGDLLYKVGQQRARALRSAEPRRLSRGIILSAAVVLLGICSVVTVSVGLAGNNPLALLFASPTPTATETPTVTQTATQTTTNTPTPTRTNTVAQTATRTPTITQTATPVPTRTYTAVPTRTHTPAPTATAAPRPTNTAVPTNTPKPAPARPGLIADFEQDLLWRRGDEPYGTLTSSTEHIQAGRLSGKLGYQFPAVSNNYVVFEARPPIGLAGRPTGVTAWIYGNGSGHYLNVWIADNAGEMRSYTFGQITHPGWQLMTAWFDEQRGWPNSHISGPDNGQLDYPVAFDGFVLDGVPDGAASNGEIYLDEVFATSNAIVRPTPAPIPQPPVGTTRGSLLLEKPTVGQTISIGGILGLGVLMGLMLVPTRKREDASASRRRR